MLQDATSPVGIPSGNFFVPGTCFVPHAQPARQDDPPEREVPRDLVLRNLYLTVVLAEVPQLPEIRLAENNSTGQWVYPIRLKRTFEFLPEREATGEHGLRVTDTIELTDPNIRVRRMSFGADHRAAMLEPWADLQPYVDELNARRRVTVVREL